MARPVKWRKIEKAPEVSCFVPLLKSNDNVPKNILKIEELEAIRLKDLLGLEQNECAERMGVSRPTFQRILFSAREIIADCLVNGKAIQIEGGDYTQNICHVKCLDCGKEWSEKFENVVLKYKTNFFCPSCGSVKISCRHSCRESFCGKDCFKYYSSEL